MSIAEPAAVSPSSVSGSSGGGGGPAVPARLVMDDGLEYLKAVKHMFKDKYNEFVEVMKDFKAQRIDTLGLITRVKELFRGHRALILGFNAFLPKGYEITLPAEEQQITKRQPVQFDQAINYVNKIKTRFQNDGHVSDAFLEILNMYRKRSKSTQEVYEEVVQLFAEHADLVEEFSYFLPDSSDLVSTVTTIRPVAANHASRSDAKTTGTTEVLEKSQRAAEQIVKRKKRSCDADQPERASKTDDGISQERMPPSKLEKHQRKRMATGKQKEEVSERRKRGDRSSAKDAVDGGKEKEVDGSHSLAGERGEELQGQSTSPLLKHDKELSRCSSLNKEQQVFFDKVKGRLRYHGLYQGFLKCLNIFNQEIISLSELQSLVVDLLGEHPDLIEGFIDVIDVRCTPSYRLDRKTYLTPLSTHRTKLARRVLNDCWVSGKQYCSFKHRGKNQHEECLLRCEDDKFELDMLVESAAATARRVNELVEYIRDPSFKQQISTFVLDDHLSATNLRCIERIYGAHGLDVIDLLRKNAQTALPVVLTRLRQKHEEWSRCRIEMDKVWKEVYSENRSPQVDHRSLDFKQQDNKSLRSFASLQELLRTQGRREALQVPIAGPTFHS